MAFIEKGSAPHSYKLNIFGIKIRFRNVFEVKSNKVIIVKENGKEIRKIPKGLKVVFHGQNSTVRIYSPVPKFFNSKIICNDNSFVSIGASNTEISNFRIHLYSNKASLKIGSNVRVRGGGVSIAGNENLSVTIGDNCLIANDVNIRTSDFHVIFDKDTKKALNIPADVHIGNHCWLCEYVTVAKGVSLADDTIVATRAYVTKSFDKPNTIIGGIPAKIIKDSNTTWSEMSYEQYVNSIT